MDPSPTRPWYQSAFDSDYLERYAHRDRGEADTLVESLLKVGAIPPEGRVLDLCCGGGRHLAAMARRGVCVSGFDLSSALLNSTRNLAATENLSPPDLVRGDMRQLPFADNSFSGVTHFFTAFGYFEEDEENFQVFREVARILEPGGTYLFDFFNAEVVRRGIVGSSEKRLTYDGRRVEKLIHKTGQSAGTVAESVRLFDPSELRGSLSDAGFEIMREWGDYDLSIFTPEESRRWIATCRRR